VPTRIIHRQGDCIDLEKTHRGGAEGAESEKFELRSSNFEILLCELRVSAVKYCFFFAALLRPKIDYFRAGITQRVKRSMDLRTLS
jgi:hypothetical protein